MRRGLEQVDLRQIRPYGDTWGDGMVQLAFTLPVPYSEEAIEAARRLCVAMGLEAPQVYHSVDMGEGYSFFILYGKCQASVDFTQIQVPKLKRRRMSFAEINEAIRARLGRKMVVVGACTGTDAHTVGIDAIMNMKGYHGDYGLERYPEVIALNMGSQVPNEELIAKGVEMNADALLVSQVVTQKGVHIQNLTQLIELLEAEGLRQRFIVICGGPRINHEMALELGFDAGFGPGYTAPDVATFILEQLLQQADEKANR